MPINNKGYTLVELIIAMAMFVVVMMISSSAFERVLSSSGQQMKSAESNIEGVVGLEMVRYDIEHAGYGLPFQFANNVAYSEVEVLNESLAKGMNSNTFNINDTSNIQAIDAGTCDTEVNGTNNLGAGPDYLVIRSSVAGLSDTARKWAYVNHSTNKATNTNLSFLKKWNTAEDFVQNDRIVTIRSSYTTTGTETKTLLMNGSAFEVALPANLALPPGANFKPADASDQVVAYGIRPGTLLMPYNRADFYVDRPTSNMPQECNPGTGILYKAVADHSGGFGFPYPLLDCVGDMQVEFEVDTSGTDKLGNFAYRQDLVGLSAANIRDQVRTVYFYILAHEGKKDAKFRYPGDSIQVGDRARPASSGRTLDSDRMATLFGADWRNYRWKIYTIATRTKNVGQ